MKLLRRVVRPHPLFLILSICWMGVIWALSARPASAWRRVGPLEAERLPVGRLAVLAHLGAYGMLGAMLQLGLPVRETWRRGLLASSIAAVYGVVDELHQSHVPGRDASGMDVVVDAVGAILGVSGARIITGAGERRFGRLQTDCERCPTVKS